MIALDTNVLLRFVLDDDAQLASAARRLIERNECRISLVAAAETGFVLMSLYNTSRLEVVDTFRRLLPLPTLHFEQEDRLARALDGVEAGIDWGDAVLWAAAPAGAALITFDKAFAKRATALGWDVRVRLLKMRA